MIKSTKVINVILFCVQFYARNLLYVAERDHNSHYLVMTRQIILLPNKGCEYFIWKCLGFFGCFLDVEIQDIYFVYSFYKMG